MKTLQYVYFAESRHEVSLSKCFESFQGSLSISASEGENQYLALQSSLMLAGTTMPMACVHHPRTELLQGKSKYATSPFVCLVEQMQQTCSGPSQLFFGVSESVSCMDVSLRTRVRHFTTTTE